MMVTMPFGGTSHLINELLCPEIGRDVLSDDAAPVAPLVLEAYAHEDVGHGLNATESRRPRYFRLSLNLGLYRVEP
jgi:hypothetical protein